MFRDRTHAGRRLADRLEEMQIDDPVVLALPRGGLPVAAEIAGRLKAPLDVILVRKLGVPWQPELAAGAVVGGEVPEVVLNEDIVKAIGLGAEDIAHIVERERQEIDRRRALYLSGRAHAGIEGRTAIVVDDGIATGATVKAALKAVRRRDPGRIVLAVPVAPAQALPEMEKLADEVVCLETPEPFRAVGVHYGVFDQVSDAEVVEILEAAARAAPG